MRGRSMEDAQGKDSFGEKEILNKPPWNAGRQATPKPPDKTVTFARRPNQPSPRPPGQTTRPLHLRVASAPAIGIWPAAESNTCPRQSLRREKSRPGETPAIRASANL